MTSTGPARTHPFHIVTPSPWPLAATAGAFVAALGGVLHMHGEGWAVLAAGVAGVLGAAFGWWRDVVREARADGVHTKAVRHGLGVGMVLFIASEAMFFVAFFWAYFHAASPLFSSVARTVWPPEGIEPVPTWGLPFLNTLILLTSGATVAAAHGAALVGDRGRVVAGLAMTVALGVIFLGVQIHEFGEATFGFTEGVFPSIFYMATGFHGFHVLVGVVFLAVCLARAARGHFTPERHLGLAAAAWYWHFVDAVWLFLFTWVYWWGGARPG